MRKASQAVKSLLILTIVTGNCLLHAGDTKEKIIARIEKKATAVKSYRADMNMTMEMMGKEMSSHGEMFFKRPNKSRMEMVTDLGTMKMEQIFVSNGKVAWTYQPKMKMVTKIDLSKISSDMKEQAEQSGDISKPFQGLDQKSITFVRTETVSGEKVYVFEGSPGKTNRQQSPFIPDKIEMWIGDNHGLLRKIAMLDNTGKEMMSQTYTNLQVNIRVPDSKFEFTPPEGVQVMDMTEGAMNMMKKE